MKRICTVLAIILCLISIARAEEKFGPGIKFGVRTQLECSALGEGEVVRTCIISASFVVTAIACGGPAAKANLLVGDIIDTDSILMDPLTGEVGINKTFAVYRNIGSRLVMVRIEMEEGSFDDSDENYTCGLPGDPV